MRRPFFSFCAHGCFHGRGVAGLLCLPVNVAVMPVLYGLYTRIEYTHGSISLRLYSSAMAVSIHLSIHYPYTIHTSIHTTIHTTIHTRSIHGYFLGKPTNQLYPLPLPLQTVQYCTYNSPRAHILLFYQSPSSTNPFFPSSFASYAHS